MATKNQDLYSTLTHDTECSPVELGAELLDYVAPGWWKDGKIDLDSLDLGNSEQCVLGQLFFDYPNGRSILAEYVGLKADEFDSAHFGFTVTGPADFADLTEDWRNQIGNLRAIAEELT